MEIELQLFRKSETRKTENKKLKKQTKKKKKNLSTRVPHVHGTSRYDLLKCSL